MGSIERTFVGALLLTGCGSVVTIDGGGRAGDDETTATTTTSASSAGQTTSATSGQGGASQGASGPGTVGAGGMGGDPSTGGSGAGGPVDPWQCPPTAPDCRRVFVTSTLHDADLGGLAGGDAICQGLADDESLGGTWMAWLANQSGDPLSRFTRAAVPYVLHDGTVIADDWDDLVDLSLDAPINQTETGSPPPETWVWTGVNADGAYAWDLGVDWRDCYGWTNGVTTLTEIVVGRTDSAGSVWTGNQPPFVDCSLQFAVYCFEQ